MRNIALIVVTILLFATLSFGQANSGVTGVVTDAAGAVVPGVTVTLTDTKTGTSQTTTTTDNGTYVFNNIKPGAGFKLAFEKQGFQTYVLNDVQLGIAKTEPKTCSSRPVKLQKQFESPQRPVTRPLIQPTLHSET